MRQQRVNKLNRLDGSTVVDHFIASLFAWWHDVANPKLAIKCINNGVKADQNDFGAAMADTILSLSQHGDKILSAKELKNLMELF